MGVQERPTVCVSAFGMATALAPNLSDSYAAARAGITRISELDVSSNQDESMGDEQIAGCRARYILPGFTGLAKALLLGKAGLADLQTMTSLTQSEALRAGISINLSDQFLVDSNYEMFEEDDQLPSAIWKRECNELIPRLLRTCRLDIPPWNQRLYFGGHAEFVHTVREVEELLISGKLDRCVVGAIDSCIEAQFLRAAAIKGALKTSENPVGFLPGEAAAFILLERTEDVRLNKREPLAVLVGSCVLPSSSDRFSDQPPDGIVLARAIDEALSQTLSLGNGEVEIIIGDLNGEEYRARDWGNALIRLRTGHNLANIPVEIPALAFGETGVATGPVGLCLGILSKQRSRSSGIAVEWLSSDNGSKAALCFIN